MAPLCPNRPNMASGSPIFKGRPKKIVVLPSWKNGTGSRARTYDLRFWRPPLYQLSYARTRAPRRSRGFLKASARSVKSGLQQTCLNPAPEIGIVDDQPIGTDLQLPPEVAGARFIEVSPALFEACVTLRVAHDRASARSWHLAASIIHLPGNRKLLCVRHPVRPARHAPVPGRHRFGLGIAGLAEIGIHLGQPRSPFDIAHEG